MVPANETRWAVDVVVYLSERHSERKFDSSIPIQLNMYSLILKYQNQILHSRDSNSSSQLVRCYIFLILYFRIVKKICVCTYCLFKAQAHFQMWVDISGNSKPYTLRGRCNFPIYQIDVTRSSISLMKKKNILYRGGGLYKTTP